MNPLTDYQSLSPVYQSKRLPMLKITWEFDFYRALAFKKDFYGKTVSELHAGNLRESHNGRYVGLFPGEMVSYWASDPNTARAEVRQYGNTLDMLVFHAYDDPSSTFPTTDCREPLFIVDGRETGFAELLAKLDERGVSGREGIARVLSDEEKRLIERISAEHPDCMMYESHAAPGNYNFLFFEKGFRKLSLRSIRLRLERRTDDGRRLVNRNIICCAKSGDYIPVPEAYGRLFLPKAQVRMDNGYLLSEEYKARSVHRYHEPYEF